MSISKHQKYTNAIYKKTGPVTLLLCETKSIEYQICVCVYVYIYMHLFFMMPFTKRDDADFFRNR